MNLFLEWLTGQQRKNLKGVWIGSVAFKVGWNSFLSLAPFRLHALCNYTTQKSVWDIQELEMNQKNLRGYFIDLKLIPSVDFAARYLRIVFKKCIMSTLW